MGQIEPGDRRKVVAYYYDYDGPDSISDEDRKPLLSIYDLDNNRWEKVPHFYRYRQIDLSARDRIQVPDYDIFDNREDSIPAEHFDMGTGPSTPPCVCDIVSVNGLHGKDMIAKETDLISSKTIQDAQTRPRDMTATETAVQTLLTKMEQQSSAWGNSESRTRLPFKCGIAAWQGKLFVMGGSDDPWSKSVLDDVYCLDLTLPERLRTWKNCASMKTKREDFACLEKFDRIYVFGGFNGSWDLLQSDVYLPEADHWISIRPLAKPSKGMVAIEFDQFIFINPQAGTSPEESPINIQDSNSKENLLMTTREVHIYNALCSEWEDTETFNIIEEPKLEIDCTLNSPQRTAYAAKNGLLVLNGDLYCTGLHHLSRNDNDVQYGMIPETCDANLSKICWDLFLAKTGTTLERVHPYEQVVAVNNEELLAVVMWTDSNDQQYESLVRSEVGPVVKWKPVVSKPVRTALCRHRLILVKYLALLVSEASISRQLQSSPLTSQNDPRLNLSDAPKSSGEASSGSREDDPHKSPRHDEQSGRQQNSPAPPKLSSAALSSGQPVCDLELQICLQQLALQQSSARVPTFSGFSTPAVPYSPQRPATYTSAASTYRPYVLHKTHWQATLAGGASTYRPYALHKGIPSTHYVEAHKSHWAGWYTKWQDIYSSQHTMSS